MPARTIGVEAFIHAEEHNQFFHLRIQKPSLKYIDQFLGLNCAPKLMASKAFPNAKEISESMGILNAARDAVGSNWRSSDVAFVSVGDGQHPRAALLAAMLTKWTCYAVDPLLKPLHDCPSNLHLYAQLIEDVTLDLSGFGTVVLAFCHSHASLAVTLGRLVTRPEARLRAVSMPCCFGDDLGRAPDKVVEDWNVLSVHRLIQHYQIENPAQP